MTTISTKEQTLESREVAKMVEKGHNDLLKDIRQYIEYLTEGNFPHSDFFLENQYIDRSGKSNLKKILDKTPLARSKRKGVKS